MVYLLKKLTMTKVINCSIIILLTGCSNNENNKHKISNNEAYFRAESLKVLNVPPDFILPAQNNNYNIPSIPLTDNVDKQIDIYPPVQPLELLNGLHE